MDLNTTIGIIAGALTAVGTVYGGIRRVVSLTEMKRERHRLEILAEAKKEAHAVKEALETKIQKLETEFEAHKATDLVEHEHIREVYNSEIKVLGTKISELRDQLNEQHSQLISLLTRLVGK